MMKIAVLDDDDQRSARWADKLRSCEALGSDHEIVSIDGDAFRGVLLGLERRRDLARSDAPGQLAGDNDLDDVDVLIVDYDLYELGRIAVTGPRLRVTGEEIAYLARCYSSCGIIVALNQFGENTFDLTLQGHPESFADLNIGSNQLHNPGLWGGKVAGFRPWAWPNLLLEPDRLSARVDWLDGQMDRPILEALGLDVQHETGSLSREALRFLGRGDPRETTFNDFVSSSGEGLDRHDSALNDMIAARIAAARIGKWLERFVLPGQDILVDAPHLISRFSSLARDRDIETWNSLARVGVSMDELSVAAGEALKAGAYQHGQWLSRPVWYWQRLFEDERIAEVRDPWSVDPAPYVFCEDVSAFVDPSAARAFTTAVQSVYLTRYVVNSEAAKVAGYPFFDDEFGIERVDYEPAVQFAL